MGWTYGRNVDEFFEQNEDARIERIVSLVNSEFQRIFGYDPADKTFNVVQMAVEMSGQASAEYKRIVYPNAAAEVAAWTVGTGITVMTMGALLGFFTGGGVPSVPAVPTVPTVPGASGHEKFLGLLTKYRAGLLPLSMLVQSAALLGFGAMEVYQMLGYTGAQMARLEAGQTPEDKVAEWRALQEARYQWDIEHPVADTSVEDWRRMQEAKLAWEQEHPEPVEVPSDVEKYADLRVTLGTRESLRGYLEGLGWETSEALSMVEQILAGTLDLAEVGSDFEDDSVTSGALDVLTFSEALEVALTEQPPSPEMFKPEVGLFWDDYSHSNIEGDGVDYPAETGEGSVPDSLGEAGVDSFPEGGHESRGDSMSYGRGGMYKGRDGLWHWPSGAVVNQGRRGGGYRRSYRRY